MKKVFFIIFCIFSPVLLNAQIDTIRTEKLGVKGKIQNIKEFTFKAIDKMGNIVKGDMCEDVFAIDNEYRKSNHSYSFDRSGNQIQETEFWSPTSIKSTQIYTYLNGRIVESNVKTIFSDQTISVKWIFKYNINKLLSSSSRYRNGILLDKYVYEYDDRGNIVSEKQIDSEGNICNSISSIFKYSGDKLIYSKQDDSEHGIDVKEYEYDSKGQIFIKKVNYDNNFIRTIKYSYNDSGLTSAVYETDENGKFIVQTLYNYDSLNNVISENQTFFDNQKSSKEYSFEGNIKPEIYNTIEGKLEKRIYKNENIIKFEKDGCEYDYKYSFDNQGNWVKIIEFKNTIPTLIRERIILYY